MEAVWARLPAESAPAYEAFEMYCQMGAERSTAAVGRALGKSKTLMDRWSSEHAWVARAAACDAHVAGAGEQAYVDEARAMAERHARETLDLQRRALEKLEAMDPAELSPRDAIRLYEMAAELERLSRGMPTEHVQTDGTAPPTSLALATPADPETARLTGELSSCVRRAAGALQRWFELLLEENSTPANGAADAEPEHAVEPSRTVSETSGNQRYRQPRGWLSPRPSQRAVKRSLMTTLRWGHRHSGTAARAKK
jgi:hypothetical protein